MPGQCLIFKRMLASKSEEAIGTDASREGVGGWIALFSSCFLFPSTGESWLDVEKQMKGLQKTLFIILVSILCLQGIRHVHNYLYRYDASGVPETVQLFEVPLETVDRKASTDELMAEYEALRSELQALNEQYRAEGRTEEDHFELRQENAERFSLQNALYSELRQRESMSEKLRDTWVFSIAGMVLVVLGVLLYARGARWLGMGLVIPGLLELMWWSAPTFSLGGAQLEYQSLLLNKIMLTVIALLIVIGLWSRVRKEWH